MRSKCKKAEIQKILEMSLLQFTLGRWKKKLPSRFRRQNKEGPNPRFLWVWIEERLNLHKKGASRAKGEAEQDT